MHALHNVLPLLLFLSHATSPAANEKASPERPTVRHDVTGPPAEAPPSFPSEKRPGKRLVSSPAFTPTDPGSAAARRDTLLPGLVLYWTLNDTSGTVASDTSGYGHDGQLIGEPAWTDGYFGQALSFDGEDDLVEIPHQDALNPTEAVTLMAWFRKRASGGDHSTGLEKRDAFRLMFQETDVDSSRVIFDFWTPEEELRQLISARYIPTEEWHHLAGVYTGSRMLLYIDGILEASRSDVSSPIRMTDLRFQIGRRQGAFYYSGEIDEVRLYDRALSITEINSAMRGLVVQQPVAIEDEAALPESYVLTEAYPNPFNPEAHLQLEVRQPQRVRLEVYNALGRQMAVLHDGVMGAGAVQEIVVDGSAWPSGLYVVRAVGETFTATRRLVLLK